MHLVLLPGNSNQTWIHEVGEALAPLFPHDTLYVHSYRHHQTGESLINLDYEQNTLADKIHKNTDVVVFAKSAGAVLTIKAVAEHSIHPKLCIFAGLPLGWADKNNMELRAWLKDYDIPTLFIQQSDDPYLSAQELQILLHKFGGKFSMVEIPGNDHQYNDIPLLKELVSKFLQETLS